MKLSQLSNFYQRLIVSSLGTLILFIAIFFSYEPSFRPIFTLLTAAVIATALFEYYRIAETKGCQPLIKIGLISAVAFVFAVFFSTQYPGALMLPAIVLGLTLISAFVYYFIKGSDPFINLAITLFGILYLVIPLSCWLVINYMHAEPLVRDGRWCLVYLLLVTKMTDTGAYFIGKKFGRIKLSPISPKKTWEGSLGGLACAVATSFFLYVCFNLFFEQPPFDITFLQSLWLGALLSITAQFGDLAESLLKRDVGVQDSSHLPGLGGVLDVVDSLVFNSPILYIFIRLQVP